MRESVELTGQKDSLSSMGKTMFSRLVLALLFCAAYAANATANVSEQVREPGIDIKELDKRASQLMHQLEMVGLSVAVVSSRLIRFSAGPLCPKVWRLRQCYHLKKTATLPWQSLRKLMPPH